MVGISHMPGCYGNPIIEVMAPSIPYKMIVVYLTTLPTSRAYNSLYMQDYFKQFFCFHF